MNKQPKRKKPPAGTFDSLGHRALRAWLDSTGTSVNALARKLGCSQPMLCFVKNGRTSVGPELRRKIAVATRVKHKGKTQVMVPQTAWMKP